MWRTKVAARGLGALAVAVGLVLPAASPAGGQGYSGWEWSNSGSAVADTGGNTAIGNAGDPAARAGGDATGGLVNAGVNAGSGTNAADGTASVNTGDASAIGNQSTFVREVMEQFRAPIPAPAPAPPPARPVQAPPALTG